MNAARGERNRSASPPRWLRARLRPHFDVLSTFAAQALALVAGLATGVITARVLGAHGRGELTLALLIPAIASLLFGAGAAGASTYLTGSGRATVREVAQTGSLLSIAGTALAVIVLASLQLTGGLALISHGVPAERVWLAFIGLPFAMVTASFAGLLLGQQRVRAAAAVSLTQTCVTFVLTAILLLGMRMGVVGGIAANIAGAMISLLLAVRLLGIGGGSLRPRVHRVVARMTLSYAARGDLGNLSQFLNYRLDSFIVNGYVGLAAVGVYSVATRLAELIWLVPNAVSTVIFSRASASHAQALNVSTPRTFRRTSLVVFASTAGLASISYPLIHVLFGSGFGRAVAALLLLLPGVALLGCGNVLTNEIAGRGHPGLNSLNAATTLVATIVLDLLLIPRWGINGAAIASTVTYSVNACLAALIYCRVSSTPLTGLFHLGSTTSSGQTAPGTSEPTALSP